MNSPPNRRFPTLFEQGGADRRQLLVGDAQLILNERQDGAVFCGQRVERAFDVDRMGCQKRRDLLRGQLEKKRIRIVGIRFGFGTRVVAATLELLADRGGGAITFRAVAERCGISPSLITYHFETKQSLIRAAAEALDEVHAEIWAERVSALPDDAVRWADLRALATGFAIDDAARQRTSGRAQWAFDVARLRDSRGPHPRRWHSGGEAFWRDALGRAEADVRLAGGLHAAVTSLGHILLSAPATPDRIAWVAQSISHLFAGLSGEAAALEGDCAWRRRYRTFTPQHVEHPPRSTPARIIAAASAIAVETGYGRLSHRAIAEKAQVSLSSTTHHFKSLDEIALAAFSAIYAKAVSAAKRVRRSNAPKTVDDYLETVLPAILDSGSTLSKSPIVYEELMLIASQRGDLAGLGLSLFALMGETTHALMGGLAEQDVRISRLTAHVFRHAMRGRMLVAETPPLKQALGDLSIFSRRLFQA